MLAMISLEELVIFLVVGFAFVAAGIVIYAGIRRAARKR